MRTIPLNARQSVQQVVTAETEVHLVHISHPDLDAPIKLSTDPTDRISTDPLVYGTRSTWKTTDDTPYEFVLADLALPESKDDVAPAASLVIEALSSGLAKSLIEAKGRASVAFAVVFAGAPNDAHLIYEGLSLVAADGDISKVRIALRADAFTDYPWNYRAYTKRRFGAIHR